jgi:hypothetical protein
MGRRRTRGGATGDERTPPFPIAAVDLLAGIGPGVELHADAPEVDSTEHVDPATTTVAETGKLLRSGDSTIRRLIRTAVLRPVESSGDEPPTEPERAGVVPRTRRRPGE